MVSILDTEFNSELFYDLEEPASNPNDYKILEDSATKKSTFKIHSPLSVITTKIITTLGHFRLMMGLSKSILCNSRIICNSFKLKYNVIQKE